MSDLRRDRQQLRAVGAPEYRITITILPDGRVQTTGPLNKKDICLKMLELARETVTAYHNPSVIVSEAEPSVILPANGGNGIDILKK